VRAAGPAGVPRVTMAFCPLRNAMGSLRFFNLQPLMETFGCRMLLETGTGLGDGVHFASCYAFDAIRPVEIHPDIAGTARDRFAADPRVHILDETM